VPNLAPEQWQAFKSELAKEEGWLAAFDRPALEQAVARIAPDHQRLPPLLFATHLRSALQLEERFRALLDTAYGLEVAAVGTVARTQLDVKRAAIARDIEQRRLGEARHAEAGRGFAAAAEVEAQGSGQRAYFETLAAKARSTAAAAGEIAPLLDAQFEEELDHRQRFAARHIVPGHAQNYAERYAQTLDLLTETLEDLVEKARAAWRGARLSLKIDYPAPPDLGDAASVHAFVMWLRRLARLVERRTQAQPISTYTVSLTQANPVFGKLIAWSDFARMRSTLLGDNKFYVSFDFDLSPAFTRGGSVRVESVGVALDLNVKVLQEADRSLDALARLRATVWLKAPPQNADGEIYRPAFAHIGTVAPFGRTVPVATEGGAHLRNVDPRGRWQLALADRMISRGSNADFLLSRNPEALFDIKLFVRVAVDDR